MTTDELMATLRERGETDEASRVAHLFIVRTLTVLNSVSNGGRMKRAIEQPPIFKDDWSQPFDPKVGVMLGWGD